MWLVLALLSGCLAFLKASVTTTNRSIATIVVKPHKVLGKVNRMIFGNNQLGYQYDAWAYTTPEYADRGAGIWDPERNQPVPEMVRFARDIGMTTARYPGGCGSHLFDWKKAVGPVSERPNKGSGFLSS